VNSDSDDFIRFLSGKTRISRSRIRSHFEQWCQDQVQQLANGKKVILEGLGFFQKENDQIKFHASLDSDQAQFYLQKSDLSFADHNEYNENTPPLTEFIRTEEKDSLNWLEVVLPMILIGLIGLLLYFLWLSFDEKPAPAVSDKDDKTEVPIDSQDVANNSRDSVEKTTPIAKDSASVINAKDSSNEFNPVDENDPEFKEELVNQGEEDKVITKANQGECIVVIGSYKKEESVQKAIDKIVELGMKAYTEPYQKFKRVGVIFDCETEDLYRKLFQLRGDFDKDAWILKYK